MRKLNAVVVENKMTNPFILQNLLKTYCQEVNIVGVAENAGEAIKVIEKVSPHVVFCDTDLPDGQGFDVIDHFTPLLPFKVIFISGNPEHAYKAIKFHPVDFILKPVLINELVMAVNTLTGTGKESVGRTCSGNKMTKTIYPDKITLLDTQGHIVIETAQIIMMEAKGNYTDIFLVGDRKLTFCRLLKELADLLERHPGFIRTHRSYLVNIEQVVSYSRQGSIKLTEGHTAQLGSSFRKGFFNCFRNSKPWR
jgi:two-component system, LytTR family, response regulator